MTRQRMFRKEEYLRCAAPDGPRMRGFSFVPLMELDGLSEKWQSNESLKSTSIYFLRGVAVTFFYQSKMSKARGLLLKVWENYFLHDLDIALMLAECACALPNEEAETFEVALQRLGECVEGSSAFTTQLIDDWDEKLMKSGRFMGYIILQYVLYFKLKEEPRRAGNLKYLTYGCFKKIVLRLSEISEKVGGKQQPLNSAIAFVLQTFCLALTELPASRKQAYVTALCRFCLARFLMFDGVNQPGRGNIENAIQILITNYGVGYDERMLYGDLIAARGFVLFDQYKFTKALEKFREALSLYQNEMKDHENHPAIKNRVVRLMHRHINLATAFADTLEV